MNNADYLISILEQLGFEVAFTLTGGQSMYINDAISRSTRIKSIFFHHEQSCTMAADAYSRASGKPSLVVVTAGPGSTNTLTGLVGAWLDSSPIMVISGQTNISDLMYQKKSNIRQIGVQGINIEPYVKNSLKHFFTLDKKSKLYYQTTKAYNIMMDGRKGPVWLDFPLDVQRLEANLDSSAHLLRQFDITNIVKDTSIVIELIRQAKRPIILVGQGIRLSKTYNEFSELIQTLNIPVITSRLGIDVISSDNDLFIGRPGTYGDRSGNFITQVADLILVMGSRLSTSTIGYNSKNFGKRAKIIYLDVDIEELKKPNYNIFLRLNYPLEKFIPELLKQSKMSKLEINLKWNETSQKIKNSLRFYDYESTVIANEPINPYTFFIELSRITPPNTAILIDTGSCFHILSQVWSIKKGQRFITTGGLSSMGYWPAGFGLAEVKDFDNIIIVTGDGSLNMNLQELAHFNTINKPIKLIVINNNGYLLIRRTQENYMHSRLYGESSMSGLWFPDLKKISNAYDLKYLRVETNRVISRFAKAIISMKTSLLVELVVNPDHELIPRVGSIKNTLGKLESVDIENMYPFFSSEELKKLYYDLNLADLYDNN